MHRTVRRRLLGAAAAATAAVAIATPAYAAAPPVVILLPDATVAAGGSTVVLPFLFDDEEFTLTHAKVTFQLGDGLAGVTLESEPIPGCTQDSPTVVTCAPPQGLDVSPDGSIGEVAAGLAATKAALGETGKLTITLAADGIDPVKKTVDVNVAEGVDLAAGPNSEISVKPGADFGTKLQVHNNSESVVHGVSLILDTAGAYAYTKQFSNCFYGGGQVTACTFAQDLAPGATYQLTMPYQLRKDTIAPQTVGGEFEWLTAGDWGDLLKFVKEIGLDGPGTPGTGALLTLQKTATSGALKQTDPNPANNFQTQQITVTGEQADLAAIGASVSGAAGATVTVPVGVRNLGPADLDWDDKGPAAVDALVTMPTGTTVTSVPGTCVLNGPDGLLKGDPSKVQYACITKSILPAGQSVTWTFGLKINKVVANATGGIVLNPECDCDLYHDGDKANDTAKIVLNAAAGGDGGHGGDVGHGDVGLPITGPRTALVGAAGAALLAGGVAFFVVSRRRRTRFEA